MSACSISIPDDHLSPTRRELWAPKSVLLIICEMGYSKLSLLELIHVPHVAGHSLTSRGLHIAVSHAWWMLLCALWFHPCSQWTCTEGIVSCLVSDFVALLVWPLLEGCMHQVWRLGDERGWDVYCFIDLVQSVWPSGWMVWRIAFCCLPRSQLRSWCIELAYSGLLGLRLWNIGRLVRQIEAIFMIWHYIHQSMAKLCLLQPENAFIDLFLQHFSCVSVTHHFSHSWREQPLIWKLFMFHICTSSVFFILIFVFLLLRYPCKCVGWVVSSWVAHELVFNELHSFHYWLCISFSHCFDVDMLRSQIELLFTSLTTLLPRSHASRISLASSCRLLPLIHDPQCSIWLVHTLKEHRVLLPLDSLYSLASFRHHLCRMFNLLFQTFDDWKNIFWFTHCIVSIRLIARCVVSSHFISIWVKLLRAQRIGHDDGVFRPMYYLLPVVSVSLEPPVFWSQLCVVRGQVSDHVHCFFHFHFDYLIDSFEVRIY